MSENYKGGPITLTTTFTKLSELVGQNGKRASQMNLYNPTGNGDITLSADGSNPCGVLTSNRGRQWLNTNPQSVYVKGTAAEVAYIDWTEQ